VYSERLLIVQTENSAMWRVVDQTMVNTTTRLKELISGWLHLVKADSAGLHYAVRVFLASTILWFLLHVLADTNPIWVSAR
jgi:hypothetical protein